MNSDEPLLQTVTHSVSETEGSLFGLSLSRIVWVVIVTVVALIPGTVAIPVLGFPIAAAIIFGPGLVVGFLQLVLFQNKPPGWFFQWIETKITGGHLSPLKSNHSCLDE